MRKLEWMFVVILGIAPTTYAQSTPPRHPPPMPPMPGMSGMPSKTDTSRATAKGSVRRPTATKTPMAMDDSAMAEMSMPVPMPKGMPMIPGLVGLTPPVTSFLPGNGVDARKLPMAKTSRVAQLKDGDTLDLSAMLVRRSIKGHVFVMYAFNGQVPGPLIRVPQNATIIVRFHTFRGGRGIG